MLHISLHFFVPAIVVFLWYRRTWKQSYFLLIATMLVDLDHLLATPIYDPNRCSIGFHPLHSVPAIILYAGMFIIPLIFRLLNKEEQPSKLPSIELLGLGLIIHMLLDWSDCFI